MQGPLTAATRLATASVVFGGGAGIHPADLLVRAAEAAGVAFGGSAALCDDAHLPRELLIGASGALLNAHCYVAFAISGAPHHVAALDCVERVVSVNHDPWAPMNDRADLIVLADANETLEALTQLEPTRGGVPAPERSAPATSSAAMDPLEALMLPPLGRRERLATTDPEAVARAIVDLIAESRARVA